jgi:methyltransferase (TIGR00027 family)
VTVFEVDHPATQQAKREVLARVLAGIAAGDPLAWHVRLVPVDFERDDLARALRAAGYRDSSPSLFVWEGVSNYLTPAAVDQTLGAVHGLAATAAGSLLVFTYVDRAVVAGDRSRFPEARRWVKGVRRRGERWRFGLAPAEVAEFLSRRGFGLIGDLSAAQAGERYFRPLGRRERGSALYHVVTASVLAKA